MQLTVNPRFPEQARELLRLRSQYGFVTADVSGLETPEKTVLEDIHLPDPHKILHVETRDEILRNPEPSGYELVSAPGCCHLTKEYHQRMEGRNIIGYASVCPILQPTLDDLRYARRYVSRLGKAILAFFKEDEQCAIYRIGRGELSIFSQDADNLYILPQSELGKFLESAELHHSSIDCLKMLQ